MFNFLHTFHPNSVLITFGPISIYWYGLFIVIGMLSAMLISFKLAEHYGIKKEVLIDLAFWLIIGGVFGARLYDILLELPYYLKNPAEVYKVWHGGLAIHGAVIAGLIITWFFAKKRNISFALITALLVPGLAFAQAIGRWGNYFNQEIFGYPTDLPWGIPIDASLRPLDFFNSNYFHPTFLYESLGNLLIFGILILMHYYKKKKKYFSFIQITTAYILFYSILRFFLEFIRIDNTVSFLFLRWPQFISILAFLAALISIIYEKTLIKRQDLPKS